MKIGITGHQQREGIDWQWVRAALLEHLQRIAPPRIGYSSLAKGTDQIFARTLLQIGGELRAVIPLNDYESFFDGPDRNEYLDLLAHSDVHQMAGSVTDAEHAFFEAGCYIANHINVLFAVWDGHPAEGFGGTADIVAYARSHGRKILHINPVHKTWRMY